MSAVDDGVRAGRRSLSPSRAEKVDFVLYKGPPPLSPLVAPEENATVEEEWMMRANYIEDDLHWLLRLPHDRFWCQVVYDSSLHECIGSFLHGAPRPYDLDIRFSAEVKQKHESLLRLFFFVCLRMSTHKESKDSGLSPHSFGEMIYENFIFDIPKIMDICVLFGRGNEAIVRKMVANIFAQQKRYYDDLQMIVSTTVQVFDTISENCGFTNDLLSPPKQINTKEQYHRNQLITMSPDKFQDIIVYLSDIAYTLRGFFDIFHEGVIYFSHENFPLKMAALYEAASTGFIEAFKKRDDADGNVSSEVLKRALTNAKGCFLHIFHRILFHSFLEPLIGCACAERASGYAEGYLSVFTGILSEKRFLADLQALFPFADDKDILLQSVYKIDHTRFQYIEDAICGSLDLFRQTNSASSKDTHSSKQPVVGSSAAEGDHFQNGDREHDPYEALGACAPRVNGIELDSLTSSVKDLFPELGDGFIRLCLEEYNYDCEKVVGAILENNLSPALQNLDRSLPQTVVNAEQANDELDENSILSQRSNIFDGDEFDMFQRAVDTSKIHVGKKNKAVDINNRTELSGLKSFYQKYDTISEMVEVNKDDYNDEYDDTYDSIEVGTIDDDSPDELAARRPFVTPRALEKPRAKNTVARLSSDEEDSQDEKKPDHFIQDPAMIRQMREERYAARAMNHRRGGRGHHGAPANPAPETSRDVKGGPKGQGQSQEVLRNRAFKERNKATRVHHNRKDMSDRKHKI